MDDLIGKQFGQYAIVEKIGEGGMAVVYKGYQESLNRYVAVKVLRGELARDQEFINRFRREALAVATLSHPNMLHVYDAGAAHGVYYIVMDYADGGSLKDLIQKGPLGSDAAVVIAIQLAEALDYAHRQGLVHRDVKPSNVLLTRDGRPLLTDFGIAKVLHGSTQLTRSGTSIGTPEYMAPEQLQGQAVDGRTDIYALGIVIFEMLSGWLPFSAPTPMAVMYKQMNEPPPPLRQVNITAPAWLEEVVNRALAKQPADRFRTAGELAAALRQRSATAVGPPPGQPPAGAATPPPRSAATTPTIGTAAVPVQAGRRTPAKPAPKRRKQSAVPILIGAIVLLVVGLGAAAAFLLTDGFAPKTSPSPIVVVVTSQAASPTPHRVLAATATPPPQPSPQPAEASETAVPTVAAAVAAVTATPRSTSPTPTSPPVASLTTSPTPSRPPTQVPTSTPAPMKPGVIADFEDFGTWRRGDQANGTFGQSTTEFHQGSHSGRLDYSFQTGGNDYVVFQQSRPIVGRPTRITAWVHGDGSGHFLNVWIGDAGGEVWQVPLGTVSHTGWEQMVGLIDTNQDWPWTHISGPENGVVNYPISFEAIVLDDKPDTYKGSGTIYIDNLRVDSVGSEAPEPTKPAQSPTGQPTAAPTAASSVTGRIVFSAGGALHIVSAQTGQDTVAPIGGIFQADLRPDGKLIIANGEGGGKTSLWSIDATTGAFIREQSPFTNDFRPFWAPNGAQFVYDSLHHGGQFKNDLILYKQSLDVVQDEPLGHAGQAILGHSPVWMQDDWVAFTGCDYWPGGTGGSRCGLYRMPSWGGNRPSSWPVPSPCAPPITTEANCCS